MAKKRFYVVWNGLIPGIYESWDECQEQIKGVKQALYKSFDTLEEAERAYSSSPHDYIGQGNKEKAKSDPANYPAEIIRNALAVDAAFARGYRHAHDIATEFADERDGYHYCYPDGYKMYDNPKPFKNGIDHIIIKGEPEGFVKRFERFTPEYYMPLSDHFPVYIDIEY